MSSTHKAVACLVLAGLLMVLGCSKTEEKNWHIGKWSFDTQMTMDNLPDDVKEEMSAMEIEQTISLMDMGTVSFTSSAATFESGNGEKETQGYKIQGRPDANTLILENEGGQIATLRRIGEHMTMEIGEDAQPEVYFKRVQ